jgi:hypothetical protein
MAQMAKMAVFMASDKASGMTETTVNLNDGKPGRLNLLDDCVLREHAFAGWR